MTAFYVNYECDSRVGLLAPCRVLVVDASVPFSEITDLAGYQTMFVVFTEYGQPFGASVVPVYGDRCPAEKLRSTAARHDAQLQRLRIRRRLSRIVNPDGIAGDELLDPPADIEGQTACTPLSVIVPTRNRPELLRRCLASVIEQATGEVEIIVADSAPDDDAAHQVVREMAPDAVYVKLDQPGVSRARNAGVAHASHETLVFLDDDVRVEPGCLDRLRQAFLLHPAIDAVTALVLPDDMTELSQTKFEALGGFNRGFQRRWCYRESPDIQTDPVHADLAELGVGACCAIRKAGFARIGGFDQRLGAGAGRFHGGEDIDLYFRIVESGGILLYEPAAMVRHRHLRSSTAVQRRLIDGAASASAVWSRNAGLPGETGAAAAKAYKRYRRSAFRLAARATLRRDVFSCGFYWRRWLAAQQEYVLRYWLKWVPVAGFAPSEQWLRGGNVEVESVPVADVPRERKVKVVHLDLSRELLDYVAHDSETAVEFHIFTGMKFRGRFRVPLINGVITRAQITDGISDYVGASLLSGDDDRQTADGTRLPGQRIPVGAIVTSRFNRRFAFRPSVSVVIPTRDRPQDLDLCLAAMVRQDYDGELEIIVVDNNPTSGLTREVVARFPDCRYETQFTPGAAAARNHGFRAAHGEIIAVTDDDVRVPPTWIRQITVPFWRQDIFMVTGSILPVSLETAAEQRFEAYGGFRFYSHAVEASARWFRGTGSRPIPTWQLGTTANMAFRKRIVDDPAIGEMCEHLGPGTPAGAGEDPYFIYRLLKEGHTLLYDPTIWVRHRHRRTVEELRRQIYNYGKSQVCYQLETMLADGDLRALRMLFYDIPRYQSRRFLGIEPSPPGLLGPEVTGHFAGLPCYLQSRLRTARR